MHPAALQPSQRFTVTDYRSWPDDERWELIDGRAYAMTPAPGIPHQRIAGRLYSRLERQLAGRPCQPFIAPVDVVLSESDVAQPDVLVVCDPARITERDIQGAPELAVEVLSPSTSARDLREKRALYERAGIGEYLVIDPLELYAQLFRRDGAGRYGLPEIFGPQEELKLAVCGGLTIPLWEIFGLEPPQTFAGDNT
jgi:Uma2 family endonuclease